MLAQANVQRRRRRLSRFLLLSAHPTEVGNFPGRALSFAVRRGGGQPRVLSYPSKSAAGMQQKAFVHLRIVE